MDKKTTLKQQFQNWMEQELSSTTPKKRGSTSYDYMRRIERISDRFFQGHDSKQFDNLCEKIVSILSLYAEYENKEHYVWYPRDLKNNTDYPIITYFKHLAQNLQKSFDIPKQFSVEFTLKVQDQKYFIDEEPFSATIGNLEAFEKILSHFYNGDINNDGNFERYLALFKIYQLPPNFSKKLCKILINKGISLQDEIVLHITYNVDKEHQKNTIALKRLCEFLSLPTTKARTPDFIFSLKEIENQSKKEGEIKEIQALSGNSPKQIRIDNYRLINQDEAAEILECHSNSLKKLYKTGQISAISEDGLQKYSFETINAYLKKHHHQANPQYKEVDYSQTGKKVWCTRLEAAEILGCSDHTVLDYARKKKLTYTNNLPMLSKYYVPELQYLKTIFRFATRRKLKKDIKSHYKSSRYK